MNDPFSGVARHHIRPHAAGAPLRLVRLDDVNFHSDPVDTVGIVMALAGCYSLDFATRGRRASLSPRLGQFGVLAPGHPADVGVRGDCLVLQLGFPLDCLRRWWVEDADADADPGDLLTMHSVFDAEIPAALLAVWNGGGDLAEERLRLIARRLLRLVRSRPATLPKHRGGLTGRRLARVYDFVDGHLSSKLDLGDLAAVADLSPFHFAREFKTSTGRSPWEYVIQRRLLRAVALLQEGGRDFADVARCTGFTHPSHLSRHLVRAVGFPPGEVRRMLLSHRGGTGSQDRRAGSEPPVAKEVTHADRT